MLTVSIAPRHLLRVLLAAVAVLFALNWTFLLLTVGLGVDAPIVVSARKFVDANTEMNLPAWFTSVLLAVVGLVVLDVARRAHLRRDRWRRHWAVLGAGFGYLSLDELVALHEKFIGPMSALVGDEGVFKYAWVAAAGPVVLVLLVVYLRFLRALPRRTATLAVLGGAFYVGGSVGLEMVASALSGVGFSEDGVFLGTVMAVEEVCEMIGPVVFLFAVAELAQQRAGSPGTAPLPAEVDVRDDARAGAQHPHAA